MRNGKRAIFWVLAGMVLGVLGTLVMMEEPAVQTLANRMTLPKGRCLPVRPCDIRPEMLPTKFTRHENPNPQAVETSNPGDTLQIPTSPQFGHLGLILLEPWFPGESRFYRDPYYGVHSGIQLAFLKWYALEDGT